MTLTPGSLSYGMAAVAFGALALTLLSRWRRRMQGALLAPACVGTASYALVLAIGHPFGAAAIPYLLLGEFLVSGLWILFLCRTLGRAAAKVSWILSARFAAAVVALAVTSALLAVGARAADVASGIFIGAAFYLGLAVAVLSLVLLDQVVRNTRLASGWSHKFVWIGLGGVLFANFVLFAGSIALGGVPSAIWNARGAIWALFAPVIAMGLSRVKEWAPSRFLTPSLVFYTSAITLAGISLILISATSYYVRLFGGEWGEALEVVVPFAGLLLVALALSSGQIRGRARVFLSKNFLPYKYDYRQQWLKLVERIARRPSGQSLHEESVEAMAALVRASSGGLWIRRGPGELAPAGGDYATPTMPHIDDAGPFIEFMRAREWVVDLEVERTRPTPGLIVPGVLLQLARARFIVPLVQGDELVAVMVIGNPPVPEPLDWEDLDLLRAAARQIASYIALEQSSEALAQSRQFEAYNRLAAFLMHDLKNLIAQLSLVVENASRHKHNPAFVDDAIDTIDNAVRRMHRVLDQLRRGEVSDALKRTEIDPLCGEVVERTGDRRPAPTLVLHNSGAEVMVSPERFAMVLEHVIRNAQQACNPEGEVVVEVRRDSKEVSICVRDNGQGMDEAFVRNRLFRPFDTTKGSGGMGIGAFQVREYVTSVGGTVVVTSAVGVGTRFTMSLPLAKS